MSNQRFSALRSVRFLSGAVLVSAAVVFGTMVWNQALAAVYQGPTQAPPGGNIPVTIWNRVSSTGTQTNAAIAIDGGGPAPASPVGISVGSTTLDLGAAAAGENLIYGVAPYANLNAGDYFIKMQSYASPTYTNRFLVDRAGTVTNTGNTVTSGIVYGRGGGNFGLSSLNLGPATTGQSALYAVANYANTHPTGDYLLHLQTYNGTTYDNRLTVTRDGNLDVSGKVHGAGCMGKTFAGLTTTGGASSNGVYSVAAIGGSYYAADAKCAADFPGSHVCRSEEILESISCSVAGDPIRNASFSGVPAWIVGGPPGYAAMANDCVGWQSSLASAYGRVWIFDAVTGGYGTQTTCNTSPGLNIACCR